MKTLTIIALAEAALYHAVGIVRHVLWFRKQRTKAKK